MESIAEEIGAEPESVETDRKLIKMFPKKNQTNLAEIWGERAEA